jgi:hypothetical protein
MTEEFYQSVMVRLVIYQNDVENIIDINIWKNNISEYLEIIGNWTIWWS